MAMPLTAPMSPNPGLRSWEMAKEAHVSLRQLQWWDERGLACPKQISHSRFYDPELAKRVKKIAQLRKAGCSLQQIRKLMARKLEWDWVISLSTPTVFENTKNDRILVVPRQFGRR